MALLLTKTPLYSCAVEQQIICQNSDFENEIEIIMFKTIFNVDKKLFLAKVFIIYIYRAFQKKVDYTGYFA